MSDHAKLVRRCRDLERSFIRLQMETGKNHKIAIEWARQWANALLDTRCPTRLYEHWISAQEARLARIQVMA